MCSSAVGTPAAQVSLRDQWRVRASLEWQPHPVQEGRIARVAADAVQQRVDFHIRKAGVASRVSLIQPFEGIFGFTAVRVRAGDLVSTLVAILRDEFS